MNVQIVLMVQVANNLHLLLVSYCTNISGCFSPEQKCDFRADCADNTDEKPCPIVYLFDDCVQLTGTKDCGWVEEPKDSLNWIVANNSMAGVGVVYEVKLFSQLSLFQSQISNEENAVYLWIFKESDDFKDSVARIASPIYQNSRADCTLRFRYLIKGNLNNDYVKVAIHPVGSQSDIFLDYLTLTEEWKDKEIGIGRRRGEFQVMCGKKINTT